MRPSRLPRVWVWIPIIPCFQMGSSLFSNWEEQNEDDEGHTAPGGEETEMWEGTWDTK